MMTVAWSTQAACSCSWWRELYTKRHKRIGAYYHACAFEFWSSICPFSNYRLHYMKWYAEGLWEDQLTLQKMERQTEQTYPKSIAFCMGISNNRIYWGCFWYRIKDGNSLHYLGKSFTLWQKQLARKSTLWARGNIKNDLECVSPI